MSSVKKHFSQQINRLNQAFSQTIGRSEKSDVLAGDLQHVDQRVECMVDVLKHTKKKLNDCLRSKKSTTTKEDLDKRKHTFDEYKLSQTVLGEAKNVESVCPSSLLSDVMTQYGEVLSALVQDMVKSEIQIENNVLEKMNKFSEDLENISQQKDKLKKLVLDMDSARSRLNAAQSRGDEKVTDIQDEFDNAYTKVENCKDAFAVDLYSLASKEVEMAGLFRILLQIQIDHHRNALSRLEMVEPSITKKIESYYRRPVYGCPLDDHLRYSGREVALVLDVCCRSLAELGLKDEGLFRISGNATKVRKLKAAFDAGETELCDSDREPHSIAGALKSYLRELPDPMMCSRLYTDWINTINISDPEARLSAVRSVIAKLPKPNYTNLRFLVKFLAKLLDNQAHTKMSSQNLAIVMAPNMIWSPSEGEGFGLSSAHGVLVELLVTNANELFPGDIQFSTFQVNELSGNGLDNHSSSRQNQLSVDVAFRGSRGVSDDSLNVDKQISPTKSTSRKSKPPPPPPGLANTLSSQSNTAARASFHGIQFDRSSAMKAVDIKDTEGIPPSRSAANIASAGHRKSNSLDRPIRPAWTIGADPNKTAGMKEPEMNTSASAVVRRDSTDQGFSASASELDGGAHSKEVDSGSAKSSTLPRLQNRTQPPPVPVRSSVMQQRPDSLETTDTSIPPTMVRVSMSDDSDDEEPVVAEVGDVDGRKTESLSSDGSGRRSFGTAAQEKNVAIALSQPQPVPRRQPTSPKEVSYVSVAEEADNPHQPTTPSTPVSGGTNSFQMPETSSNAAPVRPKPPVPSKPRVLESPDKDNSIIRL